MVEKPKYWRFYVRKNILALFNLPHLGAFLPLKGPPEAPLGGFRGGFEVNQGSGQKVGPSHEERIGGQKILGKKNPNPARHGLLRDLKYDNTGNADQKLWSKNP